jgi:hypothetical protein
LFAFLYSYDSFGRLATITYPDPHPFRDSPFTVSVEYAPYGGIKSLKDASPFGSGMTFWRNTSRNEFDQITGETFGNGSNTSRTFDSRARLQILNTVSQAQVIQDLQYQYTP